MSGERGGARPDKADLDRRRFIRSIGKAGVYAAPAIFVLLDAETAHAKRNCSQHPKPRPGKNCNP